MPRNAKVDAAYVTIPRAMELTGLGRTAINDRIADGRYVATMDGARQKINRLSIVNDIETEARKAA